MYQITFTNEFLVDLIAKLMDNSRSRKLCYVSFEPRKDDKDGMLLVVMYKDFYVTDENPSGEWIDQRLVMPITPVTS